MGKGKLIKFAELKTFDHVFEATYGKLNESDFHLKGKWHTGYFKNNHPIIVELGCGKGEYTFELAKLFPNKNFIGIDIKGARMWKGAKQSFEHGLKNVAFIRTNIELAGYFFQENEIDEIWLTFPDPQMKSTRKRLTATNFIQNYRQFLKTEGVIHLKTDSNFQYQYTLAMVQENGFKIVSQTDNLYESEILDDVLNIKTFYEKQWLARGILIKYLSFEVNEKSPLTEPTVEIEKDEYRSFGRSARDL